MIFQYHFFEICMLFLIQKHKLGTFRLFIEKHAAWMNTSSAVNQNDQENPKLMILSLLGHDK